MEPHPYIHARRAAHYPEHWLRVYAKLARGFVNLNVRCFDAIGEGRKEVEDAGDARRIKNQQT